MLTFDSPVFGYTSADLETWADGLVCRRGVNVCLQSAGSSSVVRDHSELLKQILENTDKLTTHQQ